MNTVLKNYKPLKEHYEEFPFIQVRYDDEVFLDLPICAMPFGKTFDRAVLYTNGATVPQAMELKDLVIHLAKFKKFFVQIDTESGLLKEVAEKDAQHMFRLPPDTKIEELIFQNGQILRISPEKKPTEEQPSKEVN